MKPRNGIVPRLLARGTLTTLAATPCEKKCLLDVSRGVVTVAMKISVRTDRFDVNKVERLLILDRKSPQTPVETETISPSFGMCSISCSQKARLELNDCTSLFLNDY